MKLVIEENLEELKKIFTQEAKISSEAMLSFDQIGLSFVTNKVSVLASYTKINKEFFEEYDVTGEEEYGIFLRDIVNALKSAKTRVTIEYKEGVLVVSYDKHEYTIPTLTDVQVLPEFPKRTYDVQSTIPLSVLYEALSTTGFSSASTITFYYDDGWLVVDSSMGARKAKFGLFETNSFEGKAIFPVEYLKIILSNSSDEYEFGVSPDTPLQLFRDTGVVQRKILLAPRVV